MLSGSLRPGERIAKVSSTVWERTRAAVPGAVIWSTVLVCLIALTVARSTVTADWVNALDALPAIALAAALLMGVLAVLPVPTWAALGIGFVAGPIVTALVTWPAIHAAHPLDVLSLGLVGVWLGRINDGSAGNDPTFFLFLITWLIWVSGGWLSWCVLRWRQPMLGLAPGAGAFATNVLNYPTDQNGYTLVFLILTLALLLWTNYTTSIANAARARVKLTGDARWDFWESGLVAMAALIVLGIMLPPMSTMDRTVQMESSAFTGWAQLQERLNHPSGLGQGQGSLTGSTGFSTEVPLGGALQRTRDVVFTYKVSGDYAGPRYFRGVDETLTSVGEWRYPVLVQFKDHITKGQVPLYSEDYQKLALAAFNINMILPPAGNLDILFYPGQLYQVDRETVATEVFQPADVSRSRLVTIDRLSNFSPPVATGTYNVTVEYSTATDAELIAAGTDYPSWLAPYSQLPATNYRSADVLKRIHDLAVQVTKGATTPYQQAVAIETYLRNNYTYTLTPPPTPNGVDPLAFFLFDSKQGFCEFFASAMGDMLRSIGVPTRLVNGFGAGAFDSSLNRYVVRGQDAHTWVESYFPGFGWIPFEPTADGTYFPIPRGTQNQNLCLRDNNCAVPPGAVGQVLPGTRPESGGPGVEQGVPSSTSSNFKLRMPDATTLTRIAGVGIALLLLLLVAGARYLRPRTVAAVWKRTLVLARLAGATQGEGETPHELGRRLASTFPEASEPLRSLTDGFVVAAYAPADLASSARAAVMEAWSALRPLLMRRVFDRFRPGGA